MGPEAALRALSEPRRCELLQILKDEGAQSVGQLTERVPVSQQAVSLHLKVLQEAGLVEARREGARRIYGVRQEGFRPVQEFVAAFWDERLTTLRDEINGR